jgi:hypothetical protein
MERKETNRAKQLSIDKQFQKGVKIIDVDSAIADYMSKVIIPNLEENGNLLKVPLIYGNAERWEGARKQGYLRDARGRIQIPMVMFRRSSIQKNESMPVFKEAGTIQYAKKYSAKNRYDRFSIMTGAQPVYEIYSVSIPSYVTIQYEMVIWTSFTEHMNILVEAFQNQSERYWGMEDGFKFKSSISSFETSQEVAQGAERVIRTSFTTTVNVSIDVALYNVVLRSNVFVEKSPVPATVNPNNSPPDKILVTVISKSLVGEVPPNSVPLTTKVSPKL